MKCNTKLAETRLVRSQTYETFDLAKSFKQQIFLWKYWKSDIVPVFSIPLNQVVQFFK